MRNNKGFQKIQVYVEDKDLQLLDKSFQALPSCEYEDGVHLLSEQRALMGGSILSSALRLIDDVKTRKG